MLAIGDRVVKQHAADTLKGRKVCDMNHILLQIIITFSRILKVAGGLTHDFRERSSSTAKCCLTFESLRDQLYPTLHEYLKLFLASILNKYEVLLDAQNHI